MIVSATTPQESAYFCSLLSYYPTANFRGIKLKSGNKVLAVTGYDMWTPNSVQMHVWIQSAKALFSKKFIQESFRYPFEICHRGLVIGITPGDNKRALEFNRRVGFKIVHRVPDGWEPGTDVVIQEMRKEHCRWLDHEVSENVHMGKSYSGSAGSPASSGTSRRASV